MQKNYYAIIPASVRYDDDLSSTAKLLYGELTALANEKGYCWATNQYFADLYKIHNKSVSRLISKLEEKGFVRVELVMEGKEIKERRVYINTPSNPNVTTSEQDCDYPSNPNVTTPSNRNVTENNTLFNNTINNTVNNIKPLSKNEKPKKSQLEEEFEKLWKLYPRKEKKEQAKKSYIKARKDKTTYEEVENGLYRFIEHIQSEGTERQFIPHGSTWFNGMRWNDEYTTLGIAKKPRSISEYLQQKYGGNDNEFTRNRKVVNDDPRSLLSSFEIE